MCRAAGLDGDIDARETAGGIVEHDDFGVRGAVVFRVLDKKATALRAVMAVYWARERGCETVRL